MKYLSDFGCGVWGQLVHSAHDHSVKDNFTWRFCVEHVAGVDDFEVAVATYWAATARWSAERITLRQDARVVHDTGAAGNSIHVGRSRFRGAGTPTPGRGGHRSPFHPRELGRGDSTRHREPWLSVA
jgi:hypothetical protein